MLTPAHGLTDPLTGPDQQWLRQRLHGSSKLARLDSHHAE
jgi:hypothetical protein